MKLNKLIKTVVTKSLLLIFFLSPMAAHSAPVSQVVPYYGDSFFAELASGATDERMLRAVREVLTSYHVVSDDKLDDIVKSCAGSGRCYGHSALTYTQARTFLLGNYYLVKEGTQYAVRDVYCDDLRGSEDFGSSRPAPGRIPNNNVVNVEHTWPQSRFNRRMSDDMQKSDLHHLFPTDSKINAVRGNHPFGEVVQEVLELNCPVSRFGIGTSGTDEVFEPPANHRGNVARALFYFAVRYEMVLDSNQETVLKKWHIEDPVDADEAQRNDEIFKLQKNRNPFVDYPELVERISNF